jgi:hypothetical protein
MESNSKPNINLIYFLFNLSLTVLLVSCGGSNSTEDGILLEGTLTQGAPLEDSFRILNLRHSAGEKIDEVEICALGECSTTDDEGQWGFVANPEFTGGEVEFIITGHNIATTTIINIPLNSKEIVLDLNHLNNKVTVATMYTNGNQINSPKEDHDHSEDHHSIDEHIDSDNHHS